MEKVVTECFSPQCVHPYKDTNSNRITMGAVAWEQHQNKQIQPWRHEHKTQQCTNEDTKHIRENDSYNRVFSLVVASINTGSLNLILRIHNIVLDYVQPPFSKL